MEIKLNFKEWLKQLDEVANKDGYKGSLTADSGEESWRESYLEGSSPEEAYNNDMEAGA